VVGRSLSVVGQIRKRADYGLHTTGEDFS